MRKTVNFAFGFYYSAEAGGVVFVVVVVVARSFGRRRSKEGVQTRDAVSRCCCGVVWCRVVVMAGKAGMW